MCDDVFKPDFCHNRSRLCLLLKWSSVIALVSLVCMCMTLTVLESLEGNSRQLSSSTDTNIKCRQIQDTDVNPSNDSNLEFLLAMLKFKMEDAAATPDFQLSPNSSLSFQSCSEGGFSYDDSCDSTTERCLRPDIPRDLRQRLVDLVYSDNSFLSHRFRNVIKNIRSKLQTLPGTDILLVSGCSSNHFTETQVQVRNLHKTIFPNIRNIQYVVYDLGLTPEERDDLEKYGNATVLDFPFKQLPEFFRKLRCFSWKVFIIAAHLAQVDILIWADSSVRFKNPADLQLLVDRAKRRGIQQRCYHGMVPNPVHTDPVMFEMWGDSPCAHLPYRMCEGNFGIYHNEEFVHRAIMAPWAACAAKEDCMCKDDALTERVLECKWPRNPNTTKWLGTCHRFDQSMMGVILAKLFREKYYHFAVDTRFAQDTSRDSGEEYFNQLKGIS